MAKTRYMGVVGGGSVSVGGTCRMVRCKDGILAVNLARKEDFELLAAWLEDRSFQDFISSRLDASRLIPSRLDADGCIEGDSELADAGGELTDSDKEFLWEQLQLGCLSRLAAELDVRAGELGLAVGLVPSPIKPAQPQHVSPYASPYVSPYASPQDMSHDISIPDANSGLISSPAPSSSSSSASNSASSLKFSDSSSSGAASVGAPFKFPIHNPLPLPFKVVDLSSLWAGPLAGKLFAMAGADVLKLESEHRPDSIQNSSPSFYKYLNADKRHQVLDFKTPKGREELKQVLSDANVVIENSRPRAMEHIGIDPHELVLEYGVIWISITGYGRKSNRIAYGDDAAVAGGMFLAPASGERIDGGLISGGSIPDDSVSGGSVSDGIIPDGSVSGGIISGGSVSDDSVSENSFSRGNSRSNFKDSVEDALSDDLPEFIGDAIADPLTGLEAFLLAMEHINTTRMADPMPTSTTSAASPHGALIDLSMVEVVKSYMV